MDNAGRDAPLLVYDSDCAFCKAWIEYWKELTGERVAYAPYQEVADEFPSIERERFRESVQLIFPGGEVSSGARAVFQTLAHSGARRWPLWAYERVPGFAAVTEAAYRFIAGRRGLFWRLNKLAFGRKVRRLEYRAVEWVFLKLLALVYLTAFVSFGVQASGLIGSHGILPVSVFLHRVSAALGGAGYHVVPTLLWLDSSDWMLHAVWVAGAACSALILAGVSRRAALAGAFVLYLSLTAAGQEFMSFQWDLLLLEAGFLAIFLGWSRVMIWLYRWLLFRLVFLSGAVKLLSGDQTWRHLTALEFHYQTQPIPTPVAWYMERLPAWFQSVSVAVMFVIELLVPLLIFAPRRLRFFAAGCLVFLQALIAATGNYAFFNLLAVSLCVFLLDDERLGRTLPGWVMERARRVRRAAVPLRVRRAVTRALAVVVIGVSGLYMGATFFGWRPGNGQRILSAVSPFGVVNTYGLFSVMTTVRAEIVVEGSDDGVEWRAYEFKYKPGRLDRRPPWVAPYQPRLDWQMWFAALGDYRQNPWFVRLLGRLLQGSPEVLGLMGANPFPERPPRFVRALLYEYRFTNWEERRRTGDWWRRKLLGTYVPPVSLGNLRFTPARAGFGEAGRFLTGASL